MILICPGAARTPSKAIQGVAIVYLAHVTSPNLLVFTLISVSLGLEGRSLISFGTWIMGPSSATACPLGAGAHAMDGVPVDKLGHSRIAHSFFLEELKLHAWEEQWLEGEVLLQEQWLESPL